MIHVSDVPFRRYCLKGSYKYSPDGINYDILYSGYEDKISYPLYFLFHMILRDVLKDMNRGISIRVDDLEDIVFHRAKLLLVDSFSYTPLALLKLEKVCKGIAGKIIQIVSDVNGGVIIGIDRLVNIPVHNIGGHEFIETISDLAYITSDGDFKLVLFEPFSNGSIYNDKTALVYNFWNEIHDVDFITVFTFGSSDPSVIPNGDYSSYREISFKVDERRRSLLERVHKGIADSYFYANIPFGFCNQCPLREQCPHKFRL